MSQSQRLDALLQLVQVKLASSDRGVMARLRLIQGVPDSRQALQNRLINIFVGSVYAHTWYSVSVPQYLRQPGCVPNKCTECLLLDLARSARAP